jgi:hypothetical protein
MHKISLLSKEGIDVYEFYWNFLNEHLLCSYRFFHDIFLLRPALVMIHSFLSHAIDLGFEILEHLYDLFSHQPLIVYFVTLHFYLHASHSIY